MQVVCNRNDRTVHEKRLLERLDEGNRSPGNKRQTHILPVLIAYVIHDCPALKEGWFPFPHDHAISGLPDGSRQRVSDQQGAFTLSVGPDNQLLPFAPSIVELGTEEARERGARLWVQDLNRAEIHKRDAVDRPVFRGNDQDRIPFQRLYAARIIRVGPGGSPDRQHESLNTGAGCSSSYSHTLHLT
ncbi:MAG: hypothetical protein EHM61_20945 [Acidobacteria bacterium]|nr:MAG: hypothetical protein EHM61_20945 [Acidobacteriota bacterium]